VEALQVFDTKPVYCRSVEEGEKHEKRFFKNIADGAARTHTAVFLFFSIRLINTGKFNINQNRRSFPVQ
jgi:hypothetical protein